MTVPARVALVGQDPGSLANALLFWVLAAALALLTARRLRSWPT